MAKTLLYRLFKIGKVPEPLLSTLRGEGILFMEEGVPGSATYRNFHSPQRSASWRKNWYTASLILTRVRLVGLHYSGTIIDVGLQDERIHKLQCSIEKQGEKNEILLISFDPQVFHPGWSGKIEYRFRLEQPQVFLDMLQRSL